MQKFPLFNYGSPVPADRHINREAAIRKIYSRIQNKESTAIIGNPKAGKTSLINYILFDEAIKKYLGTEYTNRIIIYKVDVYSNLLSPNKTPQDLWRAIFDQLSQNIQTNDFDDDIMSVRQSCYDLELLSEFFYKFGRAGKQLLLVIDEFDSLLTHENFSTAEFFGNLRSMATNTSGLQLLIASIKSINAMHAYCKDKNLLFASPFFNYFATVNLELFDNGSIKKLIEHSLIDSNVKFNRTDVKFVIGVSGRHPYLLQVVCSALYESIVARKRGEQKYAYAAALFNAETRDYFFRSWDCLDDNTKTVLVIMVVLHYQGIVLGKEFSFGEIEKSVKYLPELELLSELGFVEKVGNTTSFQWDMENFLLWQAQRWRLSSEGIAWWLAPIIIGEARDIPNFEKWLKNQEIVGKLLTRKQWEMIKSWINKAPNIIGKGLSTIFTEFFKGLLKK